MGHRCALLLVASLGLLAPRSAEAKDPSAAELALAKDMLREAIAEQKKGNCSDAVDLLTQVLAIKENAEAMMHLGECQASVGALVEGLASFEKADDLARSTGDKTTLRALTPKTAALRARTPTISLRLPPDVKDPAVSLDGAPISAEQTARPLAVDPGEHAIDATAEGRTPFTTKLTLAEKERATVVVRLPGPEEPAAVPPPIVPQESVSRPIPAATWILGGAAIALAAGGGVAFAVAGGKASDGEAACAAQAACDPGAIDSVRRLDAAALGMWIGAGIGAGVAIAVLVVSQTGEPDRSAAARSSDPRAARRPGSPAARLVFGPGSLRLSGSF